MTSANLSMPGPASRVVGGGAGGLLIVILSVAATFLGGCGSTGSGGASSTRSPSSSLQAEGSEVFTPRAGGSRGSGTASSQAGWTIVIAMFSGEDQDSAAETLLRRIKTRGKLPDAFVQRRAKGTIVAVGNFADPSDPSAQAEFRRIREIEVEGGKPYVLAFLAPPDGVAYGSRPEFDLRRVQSGPREVLYTLQVGYYGRDDRQIPNTEELAEFRRMAETAAATLRREGEMAFYYHSPRGSSVTIGLFRPGDLKRQESEELRGLRSRYPNSLFNGQAMVERSGPRAGRLVASTLVEVPREAASAGR